MKRIMKRIYNDDVYCICASQTYAFSTIGMADMDPSCTIIEVLTINNEIGPLSFLIDLSPLKSGVMWEG